MFGVVSGLLSSLARTLPSTVQLDGLGISFDQCPPKEWLPQNISWVTYNAFSDPPEGLLEKYDVIHVQLFITLIRDGNPVPMLENLIKMLSTCCLHVSNLQELCLLRAWRSQKPCG